MLRLLVGIPLLAVLISLVLNAILAITLALKYSSLTEEQIIATIQFEDIPEHENVYLAKLLDDEGVKVGNYKIFGDQWRMDAAFFKMKYWANIFGIESKYTLDRFEGRYKNIKDENEKKHLSYELESHEIVNSWGFFVDTTYGSSTYQDIKINTNYTILKSQTGLMVRESEIIEKKEKGYFEKAKDFFELWG